MSYSYSAERPKIFTESGQITFLEIRDRAKKLLAESGAATMEKITAGISGDSWTHLACLDRLCELKELIEVQHPQSRWGQHRIFTALL